MNWNFDPSCSFRASCFVLRISAIAALSTALAAPTAAAEVRLRSSAVAAGAVVRLADVAEITSQDPALGEALGEIPLCPAPAAGRERSLHQYELRQLLAVSGVEPGQATVTGSEAVRITFQAADQAVARIKRPLAAAGVRQAAFESIAEPVNSATVNRPPARPVEPARVDTKDAVLVERGAVVTVQARVAGVRITTSGKALDEGAAGATIGVELADTKQRVLAQVTGSQKVEVTAPTN
jgi:flagella basal body P-ring formation protein FlgA